MEGQLFESCVVLDGNQTANAHREVVRWFESCVVLDGNQTLDAAARTYRKFESCVVLDGNQTMILPSLSILRV